MNRTVYTRICLLLLCGLVLTAGWAQKTRKTPKTPQEIENFRRNHPEAVNTDPPRPTPPRPTTVSPVPYTRPGAFNPGGQPNRPPTYDPQNHPNTPGNQGGHPIDDDHTWSYPPHRPGQPDRAYPDNRQWGNNNNGHQGGNDHHGDNDHYAGCGHQGGNGYPVPVWIPQYIPVPQYVPTPRYFPAPRPRYGDGYAYYPESSGPWNAPGCGDITRFPLLGCEIIAADGTFLGLIDRDYNGPESIANRNSAYGSPYSRLSIWNAEGPYGNPDAPYSPWNRNSCRPPVLYWHGEFRGYLSTNPDLQPKVSPASLPEHIRTSPWQ